MASLRFSLNFAYSTGSGLNVYCSLGSREENSSCPYKIDCFLRFVEGLMGLTLFHGLFSSVFWFNGFIIKHTCTRIRIKHIVAKPNFHLFDIWIVFIKESKREKRGVKIVQCQLNKLCFSIVQHRVKVWYL